MKELTTEITSQATATALYGLLFAPFGESLGSLGGILVDEAAKMCGEASHDALAQHFCALLSAEEVRSRT